MNTDAYNSRGVVYAALGDYNQAIKLSPNYTNAYRNRGIAYCN
ncbi:MAG: tetratricopeptide repeat protein [Helicobacteraceae bacterium]|nr:tetratricopeptide repeat protein [Helicobacteraceae bacterium]